MSAHVIGRSDAEICQGIGPLIAPYTSVERGQLLELMLLVQYPLVAVTRADVGNKLHLFDGLLMPWKMSWTY